MRQQQPNQQQQQFMNQQQQRPGMGMQGMQQGMQGIQQGMQGIQGMQPGMQTGVQQNMQTGVQHNMQTGVQHGMQTGVQHGMNNMQPQGMNNMQQQGMNNMQQQGMGGMQQGRMHPNQANQQILDHLDENLSDKEVFPGSMHQQHNQMVNMYSIYLTIIYKCITLYWVPSTVQKIQRENLNAERFYDDEERFQANFFVPTTFGLPRFNQLQQTLWYSCTLHQAMHWMRIFLLNPHFFSLSLSHPHTTLFVAICNSIDWWQWIIQFIVAGAFKILSIQIEIIMFSYDFDDMLSSEYVASSFCLNQFLVCFWRQVSLERFDMREASVYDIL